MKVVMLISKVRQSIHDIGVYSTAVRAVTYPARARQISLFRKRWKSVFESEAVESRFTAIYRGNLWGDAESVSGVGSTLKSTENIRLALPNIIRTYGIKSILDAPCGDFNWMKDVLPTLDVVYVGGDIVGQLVDRNNDIYSNNKTSFVKINIIKDKLPQFDMMICRDCLFHLSYADTRSALENFVNSGIKYLLTTTHVGSKEFVNSDIATGDFRKMDLFQEPYCFPRDPLERIEDGGPPPDHLRQMCLWDNGQVRNALERWGAANC